MTSAQRKQLEADLWAAADNLRANSDLKASEYSTPVLGLIFLKFADNNYRKHEAAMAAIEEYKPELADVLPQDEYFRLTRTDRTLPNQLLKAFADIPADAGGDLFGHIYEYFRNLPLPPDEQAVTNRVLYPSRWMYGQS